LQDEQDKKTVALWGLNKPQEVKSGLDNSIGQLNSISIDKGCYSCTSNKSFVISAFKTACIAYHPSNVTY